MKTLCLILVFIRQPSKEKLFITCAWAVDNKSPHPIPVITPQKDEPETFKNPVWPSHDTLEGVGIKFASENNFLEALSRILPQNARKKQNYGKPSRLAPLIFYLVDL